MQNMIFLLGLLMISFLGSGVQGMECYTCLSVLNGACASPSRADNVVVSTQTCNGGSCMKYKTSSGYARECSYIKFTEGCVSGEYQGNSADVCACNSNLCNDAAVQYPSVVTYITTLVISLALKYLK